MTHEDRLAALLVRGYRPRQAEFLSLVLLHGGYFLRRQHAAFLGVVDGSRTTGFVQTLLRRHLAKRAVYSGQTQVFHLCSPSLYDAIGLEHSRLRRPAELALVTHRLMTLDVMIAHRDAPTRVSDAEKTAFFSTAHGVPEEELPRRIHRSSKPGAPDTIRYFADRVPILLGGERTTFVYVLGWAPLGAFAAFLNSYTGLLRRLPQSRVLFCTADENVVSRARRMCERRFGAVATETQAREWRRDVMTHFGARRRFEARQFRSFTQPELDQLRRDLERYAGPEYEAWYRAWLVQGEEAEPPAFIEQGDRGAAPSVQFTPHILRERYPFIGRVKEAA
jgi:hypothetical protein